jgi:hypothetical protein
MTPRSLLAPSVFALIACLPALADGLPKTGELAGLNRSDRLRCDHLKLDRAQRKAMDDFDKKLKAFWPADLKLTAPVPDDLDPRK